MFCLLLILILQLLLRRSLPGLLLLLSTLLLLQRLLFRLYPQVAAAALTEFAWAPPPVFVDAPAV
jgi:hypothetical protein